jgi:hypothetical protein
LLSPLEFWGGSVRGLTPFRTLSLSRISVIHVAREGGAGDAVPQVVEKLPDSAD